MSYPPPSASTRDAHAVAVRATAAGRSRRRRRRRRPAATGPPPYASRATPTPHGADPVVRAAAASSRRQHWGQQPPYAAAGAPYGQYGPAAAARAGPAAPTCSRSSRWCSPSSSPPAGIVLGHLAKRQIRTTGEEGDQLATWGLILSYVFTGLGLLACCGWIALAIVGSTAEQRRLLTAGAPLSGTGPRGRCCRRPPRASGPVMYDAAGEQRNAMAAATSSGVPGRPTGVPSPCLSSAIVDAAGVDGARAPPR